MEIIAIDICIRRWQHLMMFIKFPIKINNKMYTLEIQNIANKFTLKVFLLLFFKNLVI